MKEFARAGRSTAECNCSDESRPEPFKECAGTGHRPGASHRTRRPSCQSSSAPHGYNEDQLYVDLRPALGHPLFLKCEGFNFAGSIKLKAATEMVEAAERSGTLRPDSILVESSSGNLGVALSMIAASKGYRFLCVTDRRCNLTTRLHDGSAGRPGPHDRRTGSAWAASSAPGSTMSAAVCAADDRYVWLNQYSNPNNWMAHFRTHCPGDRPPVPRIWTFFSSGAGTTGTLMGCARYFRKWHRPVRIVAVDTVGSVSFGTAPGPRMIPGLGMSTRPPLLDESFVDEVVHVEEADTIRACHRMARSGFLFGGSTGTVVSGAARWLAQHDTRSSPQWRFRPTSVSATSTPSTRRIGWWTPTARTSFCRRRAHRRFPGGLSAITMPHLDATSPGSPRCSVLLAHRRHLQDAHWKLLNGVETERRRRYRFAADRDRFTLAAVLLRAAVGRVTGVEAAAVVVDRTCDSCGDSTAALGCRRRTGGVHLAQRRCRRCCGHVGRPRGCGYRAARNRAYRSDTDGLRRIRAAARRLGGRLLRLLDEEGGPAQGDG